MQRNVVVLWSLAALLLLAGAGDAQSASAPAPSAAATTLWAHHATGTDESSGWLNTVQQDGDDSAMGPADVCNNATVGPPPGISLTGDAALDDALFGEAIDRFYNLTLAPALAQSLALDASQAAQARVYFGGGSCGGHPRIVSSLFSGGSLIAQGSANHTYSSGAPDANTTISMPVQGATLTAGEPLRWQIRITGTFYGVGFLGVGPPQGGSRITLPILGPAVGSSADVAGAGAGTDGSSSGTSTSAPDSGSPAAGSPGAASTSGGTQGASGSEDSNAAASADGSGSTGMGSEAGAAAGDSGDAAVQPGNESSDGKEKASAGIGLFLLVAALVGTVLAVRRLRPKP